MNSINNSLKPDLEAVKGFLGGRMAAVDAGCLVIFCAKGKDGPKRSQFFGPGEGDRAALYVADMAQKGWDVYFGQGILEKPLQSPSRGSEKDVVAIHGLYFDGDIQGGVHKENPENLPTAEELEAFFRDEIPFKASQVIASSPDGGRHLHWLFIKPFLIRSEDNRVFIKTLSERFQKLIIKKMKAHGWKQDNTSDLVRVLRIPGTFNFKGDPVPVEMIESNGYRYKPEAILEWIDSESQQEAHYGGSSDGGQGHGDIEKAIQACEFLRHWRDHAADLTEPEWWAGICAIAIEPRAEKIIHKYSKPYPGYTPKETNKKIQEAQKLTGPMTCKGIRKKTDFDGCPSGGCGVACPVHLGGGQGPVEWAEPVPFGEYSPEPFDAECLGLSVGAFVSEVSKACETPVELAGGMCLVVGAASIQGKIRIETAPGHTEPSCLYVCPALTSGNRKSTVLELATEPLNDWECRMREEMADVIKSARSRRENQDARLKSLRARYAKAKRDELDDIEQEIIELESELEDVPNSPQIWTQDCTVETLAVLMSENNEREAVFSAEGGVFDILSGRYSNGKANLDLWLQSHSGDRVRVNRMSREAVIMEDPALTVGVSPQPEVLRDMRKLPGFWGRGLINRFLFLWPKSPLGWRGLNGFQIPAAVSEAYAKTVTELLSIECQKDGSGREFAYTLRLDNDAYQMWREFSLAVELLMRPGEAMEFAQGWASKLPGAAGRIAAVLHCFDNTSQPWAKKVSRGTMERALDLAGVFLGHAQAVFFNLMGRDESVEGAQKVWAWVNRSREAVFTRRDCHNTLQGNFQKVADLEPCLDILEERHFIAKETVKTGGRPSVSYKVNPKIMEDWKNGVA